MIDRLIRRRHRRLAAVGALVAGALAVAATSAAGTPDYGPPQTNWEAALAYSVTNPEALPTGMSDPGCRPAAAHPRPVILINGAFLDSYANWAMYSPRLRAEGYCVFGLNYGGPAAGPFHQMGDLRESAREIGAFVDRVRAATGSDRVDLVGYSEGGLVPFYYLNMLGGAPRVDTMISLDSPVRGMSGYGVLAEISALPGGPQALGSVLPAARDGAAGSAFIDEISAGGQTRPEVRYVTITSRADLVVAPEEARLPSAPNVSEVVVQDNCPQDQVFHGSVIYDDITLRLVLNALDPANAVAPVCHPVLPVVN
ncbi:Extracellular esterase EstB [Nocardia cerradoensis]|uniref:Extracellular esterase EstB n=1 Tax=Nocardia cerradoensis TaxID=85688 RepID=A0A231GZ69_9NOCA|nr:alpha/beta fold hydrolase [Nocardia cerradoensis]OXR41888.1 Extracellular esterase EstB [Nocardia cerradoensis]